MTKSDLKTGMIVECRNGEEFLVLTNCIDVHQTENSQKCILIATGKHGEGYLNLNSFTDDLLEHEPGAQWDIVKIYELTLMVDFSCLRSDNKKLIWEREKEKELTMHEIEKLLGYPIKIVKG